MSKISKLVHSIRFEEFQVETSKKYLDEQGNTMNFSELVRLSLSVYLRNKMIDKKQTKNNWIGF